MYPQDRKLSSTHCLMPIVENDALEVVTTSAVCVRSAREANDMNASNDKNRSAVPDRLKPRVHDHDQDVQKKDR